LTAIVVPQPIAEAQRAARRVRGLKAVAELRISNCWLRLGASGVAAVVASSLVGTAWPLIWYLGLIPIVLIDRVLYVGLLKRCETKAPPKSIRGLWAWTVFQSAYGNVLAAMLWFAPYVPGETLAVMYLCGGLANGATSLRAVPSLALCGMGPGIATMLALPVAEFLIGGSVNTLELAPLVGGLLLLGFGVNVWRTLVASDTAQLEAEAAVLRERQAAAAAAAAKTDMIQRMNNELRTPMSALIGAAEHLKRAAASPQARAHIATLVQAGEVLKLVLDDLSDLDRLENGRLSIKLKPTDPRELARGVVSAFRAAAQDKQIELFLDIAQDTPPLVVIDSLRVRQVLFNLLANAVRFTTHGGVRVRVSAQPTAADRVRLIFVVADTGAGMSRSQVALIFGRERISIEGEGRGLGLAISMKLARLMAGQLTARSELGQGSMFQLTLDAQIAVAQDTQRQLRAEEARKLA
jgi:signal transduction histidine kinase